jgi:hypothetical protein
MGFDQQKWWVNIPICDMFNIIWLVVSTPLKTMKVSWDEYSQYMEKMFQTNNQLFMMDINGDKMEMEPTNRRENHGHYLV